MKKVYLLMFAAIVVLAVSASAFLRKNTPNNERTFSYTVTSKLVAIKVAYNPEQSPQVERYIDSCLQPEVVFGEEHTVNKEVQINNGRLNYHVKGEPGWLKITAERKENDVDARTKLREILEGLKSVVKPG